MPVTSYQLLMLSHFLLLLISFISVFLLLKLLLHPHPRRLAGPVIIAVVAVTAAWAMRDSPLMAAGLLLAAALTVIFGAADDAYDLSAGLQLAGQALTAAAAVLSGWTISFITNPFGTGLLYLEPVAGGALAAVWLVILMNAINWLDGSDGLAGSVIIIAFITLIIVSVLPATQDERTLGLALIGLGAAAAFLVWNWPPAKIYLGTSGSWFLGLYLGLVAMAGQGKIALTALVLALPLLDAAYVIVKRLLSGQSPWRGDTISHFHHRLRARGLSPRSICLIAAAVSAVSGFSALLLTLNTTACPDFDQAIVNVAGHQLSVGLAATSGQQSGGLSGCRRVPEGRGLYFVFNPKQTPGFWMKDMLIPIDIIWITDSQVVGVEHSVPPPNNPDQTGLPRYTPPQPVDAVLELPAGAAGRLGIKPGVEVVLSGIDKLR